MKYIRTEDGIYKAIKINGMIVARGGVAYSCDIADVHFPIVFKEQDIIAKADTIEELCDEFVAFENGFLRPRLEFKNIDKTVLDTFLHCAKMEFPNADLFGAIWTEWGLKYVAKMNDKGELELL